MKNKKGWMEIVGLFVILIIFLSAFITFIGWSSHKTDLRECEDYNSYGYYTEIGGDLWDSLNGREVCLIIMEDGTKLPLRDFKTMSMKNAKVR